MDRPSHNLSRPPHYEPPLDQRRDPRSGPVQHLRSPELRAPRRTPHDGRSTPTVRSQAEHAGAQRFAEHGLRLALEVLDRRRSPAQLRSVADAAVVDALRVRARGDIPARRLGAALLGVVHLRYVNDHAVEVWATYNRGPRWFALAGRMTAIAPDTWRVTALQIG